MFRLKKRIKKEILLDIDGVLSPLGITDSSSQIIDLYGWAKLIIPDVNIQFLKHISKMTQITWISNWEDLSNCINRKVNLPDFNYLKYTNTDNILWTKETILLNYCNKKKSYLIIDDSIPDESKLWEFPNILIIKTEPNIGLSIKDRTKITNWLDS